MKKINSERNRNYFPKVRNSFLLLKNLKGSVSLKQNKNTLSCFSDAITSLSKDLLRQTNLKRLLLPNLPYVFLFYLADKLGQAYRITGGVNVFEKILMLLNSVNIVFEKPMLSFHGYDLLSGLIGAILVRFFVYQKSKNAKKYRKGEEYGSARWGTHKDIEPFMDKVFKNNIPLTQTEGLMMESRPKIPKNARNKNILVVGGSGSGKTRFFVKPSLMQMHSSYVVTDPKGTVILECGKMLADVPYVERFFTVRLFPSLLIPIIQTRTENQLLAITV